GVFPLLLLLRIRAELRATDHAGADDAIVDPPVEVDRPAAAAVGAGGQVGRARHGAPVIEGELAAAAIVRVALQAVAAALRHFLLEEVPAALDREGHLRVVLERELVRLHFLLRLEPAVAENAEAAGDALLRVPIALAGAFLQHRDDG